MLITPSDRIREASLKTNQLASTRTSLSNGMTKIDETFHTAQSRWIGMGQNETRVIGMVTKSRAKACSKIAEPAGRSRRRARGRRRLLGNRRRARRKFLRRSPPLRNRSNPPRPRSNRRSPVPRGEIAGHESHDAEFKNQNVQHQPATVKPLLRDYLSDSGSSPTCWHTRRLISDHKVSKSKTRPWRIDGC